MWEANRYLDTRQQWAIWLSSVELSSGHIRLIEDRSKDDILRTNRYCREIYHVPHNRYRPSYNNSTSEMV